MPASRLDGNSTPFQGGAALSVPLRPFAQRPSSSDAIGSTPAEREADELICAPLELSVSQLLADQQGLHLILVLERSCSVCAGAAFVPVTVTRACGSCTASGVEVDEGTKQPCSVCDGTCAVPVEEMEQCERCDGTGLELTPAGQRLLRLAGPQLRVFLERWRDWGCRS
jgi:hypothetical protein